MKEVQRPLALVQVSFLFVAVLAGRALADVHGLGFVDSGFVGRVLKWIEVPVASWRA